MTLVSAAESLLAAKVGAGLAGRIGKLHEDRLNLLAKVDAKVAEMQDIYQKALKAADQKATEAGRQINEKLADFNGVMGTLTSDFDAEELSSTSLADDLHAKVKATEDEFSADALAGAASDQDR